METKNNVKTQTAILIAKLLLSNSKRMHIVKKSKKGSIFMTSNCLLK